MLITQEYLNRTLNKNGWSWFLVSNPSPGMFRLQMGDDGEEETLWRKCFEAPTLEQAIADAEQFISSINAYEYGKTQNVSWGEATEHGLAADCPECGAPGFDSVVCEQCGYPHE